MKTLLLSLGLCAGRRFLFLAAPVALSVVLTSAAHAQTAGRILYPQNGQDVRGEITVRLEGIPSGGYAIVKLDDQIKLSTAQNSFALDTLADPSFLAKTDGQYTLEVVTYGATGGRLGADKITFNVANKKIVENGESVRLSHWVPSDVLRDGVVRYRVFAESNATISGGSEAGGAGAGGGDGGAEGGEQAYIPAPLDWQVAALLRRMVRNIGGFDNSANIATIVQESHQRQRLSEGGAAGAAPVAAKPKRGKKKGPSAPVKAPWNPDWMLGPETGQHFVKTVQQTGDEINATRKSITISLADLLPTFPTVAVVPGSTWSSKMSILGDLSSRQAVNIEGPITFTNYENILTSGGQNRRCAKLESRFRLPDSVAKRIAANLANQSGAAAGGAGGGEGAAPVTAGAQAGAEAGILPEDIEVAQVNVARVIWFDMDKRQIVRAEDNMNSYFEMPLLEAEGAAPGGEAGAEAVPSEPTKISYNLKVTTWLDDKIPPVNYQYTGGAGTAHGRDSVTERGLSRATQPR